VRSVEGCSGDGNPESGNCHPELGNRNPDSGDSDSGKENDRQGEEPVPMDINVVFTIPAEFCAPMEDIAELALGVERAVFEKPENPVAHMKPLFIGEHLDRTPIGHMLIDGGANINILSLSLFKKLGHVEGDLKRTNDTFIRKEVVQADEEVCIAVAESQVDILGKMMECLSGRP
jgi:hypothetical protein